MTDLVNSLENDFEKLKNKLNEIESDAEDLKYEYEKIDYAEMYVEILNHFIKKVDICVDAITDFTDLMLKHTGIEKNKMKKLLEAKNSAYESYVLSRLNLIDEAENIIKDYGKMFSIYKNYIPIYMEVFEFASDDATLIICCEKFDKKKFIEALEKFLKRARNFDEDKCRIEKDLGWTE